MHSPHGASVPGDLPDLSPGVTVLDVPSPRSTALHRLVVSELDRDGVTYWVDTGNVASTYALYDLAPRHRLADLRVARAFTAYQHYALVREAVRRASPRTAMLVLPNLGALYRDGDVPDHEATALLGAVVDALAELAASLDLPVLVTDPGEDDLAACIREAADAELTCERTSQGFRYTGEGYETTAYWTAGYWQTTIPYWVEVCGAVGDRTVEAADIAPGVVEV